MYFYLMALVIINIVILFIIENFCFPRTHKRRRPSYDLEEQLYYEGVFASNFPFLSTNHGGFLFLPVIYYIIYFIWSKNDFLLDSYSLTPIIWATIFSLIIIVFLYSKVINDFNRMDFRMRQLQPNFGYYLVLFVLSASVLSGLTIVHFLNYALDFFTPEEKIVTVTDTEINFTKHNTKKGIVFHRHYNINFFPKIGGIGSFEVYESEYGKIWKDDRLKLFIKKGLLGMPYISSKRIIIKKDTYEREEVERNIPKNIDEIVASLVDKMVKCPEGSFLKDEIYDSDKKSLTISKLFYIGKYEVTQKEYTLIMGNNPSKHKGDNYPVENVSWDKAKTFCEILNKYRKSLPTGYRFDLPTELQWEYACRAGTNTDLNSGKKLTSNQNYICPNLDEVGWYAGNADNTSHEVGQKKPNAWGIYDMHGNVAEWCRDDSEASYSNLDKKAIPDMHAVRGGAFWAKSMSNPVDCCSSFYRISFYNNFCDCYIGFRLALVSDD